MVSLALDEKDYPQVRRWRACAMGYFRKNFFPGWQRTGGGWQGGGHAYFCNSQVYLLIDAIACWQSATEQDVFGLIRKDYGNWLEEHMYFMIYQTLPDGTRVDSTGFDYAPHIPICPVRQIMMIARGYRNPDGYAYLRKGRKYEPKQDLLLYDERTDAKRSAPLPLTRIWGRNGLGYVQMRSGWGQDATVFEFKCGDYFWSHNMLNQNGFFLFRKGRLAIQSGLYDQWGSNHFSHYYSKAISGNNMLIFQPGEFTWCPDRRTTERDAEGRLAEHGGQRAVLWGGENCFTFRKYLWSLKPAPKGEPSYGRALETGNILAYETAPDFSYSYVCGDATDAYSNPRYAYEIRGRQNKPKISRYTRSVALLGRAHLVMFDRVDALDPACRKAWLIHAADKPEVSGKLLRAEVPGHIEDFDGDRFTLAYKGGKLFGRVLLPAKRYVRRIGGAGYEFWAGGKNRPPVRRSKVQLMGAWRLEVSPAEPARSDVFLHVLYPCDREVKRMPACEAVNAEGEKMLGASVGGWLVMFGHKGPVNGEVRYAAPAGRTEHLVVDLTPGARYRLSGAAGDSRQVVASAEGVLRFATRRKGDVVLTPVP
jgi:hypothetical protein